MSKRRKTNHLRAGRPASGRVTPRATKQPDGPHDFFDIDLDAGLPDSMITATFDKFGPWALPIPFLEWLDQKGLVEQFDDFACLRRDNQIHGDGITPFLEQHNADQAVIDEVRSILTAAG